MATSSQPEKHILVFGTTGLGKSNLINNIAPGANLKSLGSVRGVTLDSTHVDTCYNGQRYRIIDTAGLDEDKSGSVHPEKAIKNLFKLLKDTEKGLNLVIMVTRGRVVNTTVSNYKLFVDEITSNKIPVVVVQTHLDDEENRAEWVKKNEENFTKAGIKACAIVGTAFPKFNPSRESNSDWADGVCIESMNQVWTAIERFASRSPVYYFDDGGFVATFVRLWGTISKTLTNIVLGIGQTVDLIQKVVECSHKVADEIARASEMLRWMLRAFC